MAKKDNFQSPRNNFLPTYLKYTQVERDGELPEIVKLLGNGDMKDKSPQIVNLKKLELKPPPTHRV